MRHPNKRRLILITLILAHVTVRAATLSPGSTTTPLAAATPNITGFTPAGGCIAKGSAVTGQGSGLGVASGKSVTLSGNATHVDPAVSSWSNTAIITLVPDDPPNQGR